MRSTRRGFVLGITSALAGAQACRERPDPTISSNRPSGTAEKSAAPTPNNPPPPDSGGMPKRRLGTTGVQVSMLGLGGHHIGQKKLSDKDSIDLMRSAIDGGVTFLDNCWDYNEGASEERMGKALADGYRRRVFLMTKIDGRNKEAATAQLEQSLQRLKTDMIDLVQIHEVIHWNDPERSFAPGGVIEALVDARKAGKLRFIGFTGHKDPKIHLAMLEAAKKQGFRFDAVQLPLNVMDAHYQSFEQKVLPVLVEDGIGVLGMKSMGSGDILKSGVVTPEECLRYSLSLPTSVVISGMDSKDVLQKNLALARSFRPLSSDERKELLARTAPAAKDGKHELFKTSRKFDGTVENPHWLEQARL